MAGKTTSTKSNVVALPSAKKSATKAASEKTAVKKTAPKAATEQTVLMKLKSETKGAYVYSAIDSKGNALSQDETVMPSVYFRKSHLTKASEFIEVAIRSVAGLTAKPKVAATEDDD